VLGEIVAPGCLHARTCPISSGPCPGECVFADVMRSANLGILVFDTAQETLLFANQEARQLLKAAGVEAEYGAARAAFDPPEGETSGRVQQDTRRMGARLVGFTKYSKGVIDWIFFRDISDRARLEAVAEAIELANSLGHVFTAVRHEIGNPINSSKMALSVLRRNFDYLGRDSALEYLDAVLRELERMSDTLASLKSFNLYETVHPLALEIDSFLDEVVQFALRDFRRKGISLRFRGGAPAVAAHADPRALRQVFMSLLANCADALSQRQDGRVEITTAVTDSVVIVQVLDNGPGISREALQHVFEPFFTTKTQGTGLGLAIARKMLARMDATIAIESPGGQGASVVVTLRREHA
jgi:signal transduction histidine kinase